jgi:glutaredoxin-like protein
MERERPLLGQREVEYVQRQLEALPRSVTLISFTEPDCPTCQATEQLAREIAEAVPRVVPATADRSRAGSREVFAAYGIDRVPALALSAAADWAAGPDNGIRFFGFPGGYEFESLLQAIQRVARADAGLSPEMAAYLTSLGATPLHLQVFVTPTCPYCPRMVQLVHRMALFSPAVRGDMVEATQFPDWAERRGVRGVPLTVDGEGALRVEGLVPEGRLLRALRERPEAAGTARTGRLAERG